MKKLVVVVCLAAMLGAPFCLREMSGKYEPYPAVLFPVGSGKINLDASEIRYYKRAIYAVDPDQTEHELEPRLFFAPIPDQYWTHIASETKQFGLANAPAEDYGSKQIGQWRLNYDWSRPSTEAEKREVVAWLAQRLAAVGRPESRTIVVRFMSVTVDTDSGEELDSEIHSEYEIQLDDYEN